jgi:hypothetical protein
MIAVTAPVLVSNTVSHLQVSYVEVLANPPNLRIKIDQGSLVLGNFTPNQTPTWISIDATGLVSDGHVVTTAALVTAIGNLFTAIETMLSTGNTLAAGSPLATSIPVGIQATPKGTPPPAIG